MATLNSINYTNTNLDLTVRVFDSFYGYDANVPAAEYDVVNSYFVQQMGNSQAAGNFTASLFRVAEQTGIPALTLLDQFQNEGRAQSGMSLNVLIGKVIMNNTTISFKCCHVLLTECSFV